MNIPPFKIVTLEQGTPEWLEWRRNGIGASDASSIMEENRFKSSQQLLREKLSPAFIPNQNAAMARGTRLEPEARKRYIARTGKEVQPACLQSTKYDWLRASLDGISFHLNAVVEIKCGESAYRHTSLTRTVPTYYYGQLQHILAITGFNFLDFWCYLPGRPEVLITVPRNEEYINRLLAREEEFWKLVRQGSSL